MANGLIGQCPVCKEKLDIVKLHCPQCDTSIEGKFENCKFSKLSKDQQYFLEIFVKSRGNIKEVEKELGISYPTVRSRLDSIIESLGYKPSPDTDSISSRRKGILEDLESGKITSEEAVKLFKQG